MHALRRLGLGFALVGVLLASPVSAQALAPSVALMSGSGADLIMTLHALRTIPGAREGNPLLSHGGDSGLIAGKVATTTALVFVLRTLTAHGHPRWAKVLGYGGGIALGAMAARNASLSRGISR
jgi:hypothetical protein